MHLRRKILLVGEDPEVGNVVAPQLQKLGCQVNRAHDGTSAMSRFLCEPFDLVVLDRLLPDVDGFDVCRQIRLHDRFIPILMLTAHADKRDVVLGLELGADDYLTKPFYAPEIVARINALFRRIETDQEDVTGRLAAQPIQRGALTVYPARRRVLLHGQPVALTSKEFDLLLLFARNPGRTFSRSELLNEVWGPHFDGQDHTVNTHINRLRNKIETDVTRPVYLQTAWGIGYRFADLDELTSAP